MQDVPQIARSVMNCENCDYVNQCSSSKDCYLIFEADYNQQCYFSNYIYDSKSTFDCFQLQGGELCYEAMDCRKCYNLKYSQDCDNCSDSWFLASCIGCKNCFGSVNLRNKEYYFLNERLDKETYLSKIAALNLHTRSGIQSATTLFSNFRKNFPKKYLHGTQNEDSSGDYLWNTQRCKDCFDLQDSQDCSFVTNSRHMKNVYDVTVFGSLGGSEFCYENHEIGDGTRNVCFSDQVFLGCSNILYSKLCCENSRDLFGCVGLRHKQYCIFNKQYTKEEYETLVPRIIEHMKKTGEWGEFFPSSISPMGYNETVANTYFPLSKEEAFIQGFAWSDYENPKPEVSKIIPGARLPDEIKKIPDDVLNWAIQCEKSGKLFKIVPQELKWYRAQDIPVPMIHPEERFMRRFRERNPRKLNDRACSQCQAPVQTTYPETAPEKIVCEKCYLTVTD